MKKLVTLGLTALLGTALVTGCQKKEETTTTTTTTEQQPAVVQETETTVTATTTTLTSTYTGSVEPEPEPPRDRATPAPSKVDLVWNAWAEEPLGRDPTFKPAQTLLPKTAYNIYLDLSAFAYRVTQRQDVYNRVAGSSFKNWATDWLPKSDPDTVVPLKALFLVSSGYFDGDAKFAQDLPIRLGKIKAVSEHPLVRPRDPLAELRVVRDPPPPWMFGRASYRLSTRDELGMTSIAISIWQTNPYRPLDEIGVPLCVAPAGKAGELCRGSPAVLESLGGTDSLRVSQEKGASPDAAFQFFDSGSSTVFGIFHESCDECPYLKWEIEESFDTLRKRLQTVATDQLEKAIDSPDLQELLAGGRTLYDVLVKPPEVRSAVAAFVAKHLATPSPTVPPSPSASTTVTPSPSALTTVTPGPSVLVRILGRELNPLVVPLGLMAVDPGDGQPIFLGEHFRIEQPLGLQTYESSSVCVDRWVTVVGPGGTTEVGTARRSGGDTFERWLASSSAPYEDLDKFRDWVQDAGPKLPAGTGLLLLGHQDQDAMWHDASKPHLVAENLRREFGRPSLAVLDGCGFGAPSAGRFIRNLNENGIPAVITTSASVTPEMAGAFLACFGRSLQAASASTTLREAYTQTITCLETEKGYGSLAQFYSLLGNGAIKVCAPRRETQ